MKKCTCGACANTAGAHSHTHHQHTHTEEATCSCGSGHSSQSEHGGGHEHGHGDDTDDEPASSCGCGCSSNSGEPTTRKQDIISIAGAILLAIPAMLVGDGIIRLSLMLAAILLVGFPIFLQGIKNIFKLDFEELALLTIAVTAACIIGEYPEALLVTMLFRVGEMLEDIAVSRSKREVEAITKIIPENANLLLEDGKTKLVSAKALVIGQHILVKSGERIAVDGIVLSGESSLDTSSLTGESTPREVSAGDNVLSGSVNVGGVLTIETTSVFENSTAARIVEMVKDAAARKGTTERMISRFARVYTPIVIIVAIIVAVLPPLLGFGTFTQWIGRSLVFLVASCPCALVISVPLSFFAGIGAASKQGILIKGSRYIEALALADCIVFDKTGTLTEGRLSVSETEVLEGCSETEMLRLAAICESYSNHPIARAIVQHVGTVDAAAAVKIEEITAHGISAEIGGETVLCGSARLMEREGISVSSLKPANVYISRAGRALGAIHLFDNPRGDAAEAITSLHKGGITRTVMLTGDSRAAAEKTAKMIGLDDIRAELLPQDKVEHLQELREKSGGKVIFVGDGVNDAPVLAAADAGVAMGFGSDSAIEAADVVLLSDKLSLLPQAICIAKRTSALARFNIVFALAVKLAVFVLAFLGIAQMWMAVFADVGVSILAVMNATRALRFK